MKPTVLQKRIILIGVVVIVLMGLFPPWKEKMEYRALVKETPVGYSFIAMPLKAKSSAAGIHIDFSRLLIQWILVVVATAGVLVFCDLPERPPE